VELLPADPPVDDEPLLSRVVVADPPPVVDEPLLSVDPPVDDEPLLSSFCPLTYIIAVVGKTMEITIKKINEIVILFIVTGVITYI
jgi:hypothetical protein